MTGTRPLILVTNDDGIHSPGLIAAAEAVASFGELLIATCAEQQTAMSRAYPKGANVGRIETLQVLLGDRPTTAYAITGSPAIAVSHAVLELAGRRPDLCVSGVNYGENIGRTLTGSGTIGAALEADSYGIPSLAVSLEASVPTQHSSEFTTVNWLVARQVIQRLVRQVLTDGFPAGVAILNVNLPNDATSETPVRRTIQSRRDYFVFQRPNRADLTTSCRLPVTIEEIGDDLEADSDIRAVVYDRVISVTPLTSLLNAQTDWQPRLVGP